MQTWRHGTWPIIPFGRLGARRRGSSGPTISQKCVRWCPVWLKIALFPSHKCVPLVVSRTDSEKLVCLSACLSDQGHYMVTDARISFETATPMPHASVESPRGGDRHDPNHTTSRALPVCGVIRVDFQHPHQGDGSSSSNRSPRPAKKLFNSIFNWKIG